MNPLAAELARLIAADGPLPLSRFMAEALGHPKYGYYTTREPFGTDGDFVTAPEISQMFGELVGLWCAQSWLDRGGPAPCALVELGPGRGTCMADALRAAAALPAFRAALTPHLVEMSPRLRERQRLTLAGHDAVWHEDIATLPDGPALIVANEFFDALPIRQFQRAADGWHERVVGLQDCALALALAPGTMPESLLPAPLRNAAPDSIVELSPARSSMMRQLAERIVSQGGALLAIDYGYAPSAAGDTLQAVRAHRPVPVLETPGKADLTAHVDFQALAEVATEAGATVHGPTDQGDWLRRMGIKERAAALQSKASPEQAQAIDVAVARLTEPAQMGTLFKVLAVTGPDDPAPAGFEGAA